MNALSAQVAEHVAGARAASIPAEAMAGARRSLLDALGVTLAASGRGEGCRAVVDQVVADGGAATSVVLGYGVKVPAAAAAFANGAMAHAVDFEDAHDTALVHPNAQTVPAVLALAGERAATGREVLAAVAVGGDLVCRLGLALRDDPARRGWYPPAILQAFGAAAGAARMLRLDAPATLDALSLTLAQVTGTAEMTRGARSVVRGIRDAFGAQAGVRAAQLAARGVHGFDEPLEGEAGLFGLYAEGRYSPDVILEDLGRRYEGARLSYKPWPSCRGTHAAIEAALRLRADGLDPSRVTDVLVVGASLNRMLCEPREQRTAPRTAIDAKFSLPFTVARALWRGSVDLDAFEDRSLSDPDVLSLARLVRYEVDSEDEVPGAATRCRLEVTTDSGHHVVTVDPAPGGPAEPMTDADLGDKFLANAAHAAVPLRSGLAERLAEAVADLDASSDVGGDLLDLLAAPAPRGDA